MKIQLEGRIYLESDEMQFVVKKYSEKPNEKTDEYSATSLGYYPKVEQALNAFADLKIRQSDATTLHQLREDVQEVRALIASKIDF